MRDDLLRRLKAAREIQVEAGGYTFTARRPTDVEAVKLYSDSATYFEIAREFVVDWGPSFTEADLIKGGASDALPFERVLWAEWLADRPALWVPIKDAVIDNYREHVKRREAAAKN